MHHTRFIHRFTLCRVLVLGVTILIVGIVTGPTPSAAQTFTATTSVSLTVCGDAVVSGSEVCDDGTNTGAYSGSIASRNCNSSCSAYGEYCGDYVTQVFQGEECDDGNNTSGDYCDATCQNETTPVTTGGGSGGTSGGGGGNSGGGQKGIPGASTEGNIDFNGDTDVIIRGLAYPGATVSILRDGEIERVVEADSSGVFGYTLTEQTAGITTFGFWALDRAKRSSITYSATFQIVQNAVTTLSGILIPPTLAVVPEKTPPGSTVQIVGTAAPNTTIRAFIDGATTPEETLGGTNGEYAIAYDTTPLTAEQFHTVKAHYLNKDNADLKSGFSALVSFYVGTRDVDTNLTADLNGDGAVNLTDFSILLFNWNSNNPVADINTDGTVSLADFSILLFYWTG